MPRRRKIPPEKQAPQKRPQQREEKNLSGVPVTQAFTGLCIIVALCVGFKGYLETRVNTRFDDKEMVERTGLDVPDRYWGSYRPGLYFGMKTRDPYSLVFGLMWYFPRLLKSNAGIRHWCEQSDNLRHYTWTEHDGRNFGVQEIDDGPFHLETSFVKRPGGEHGGDWTARVSVSTLDPKFANHEVSLIFYAAIEEKTEGWIEPHLYDGSLISGIRGETKGLGSFKFTLFNQTGDILSDSYLSTVSPGLDLLKEVVMNSLRVLTDKESKKVRFVLPGELLKGQDGARADPNFVALQVTSKLPFEAAFAFESGSFFNRQATLNGEEYDQLLSHHREEFHSKFERVFKLKKKGFNESEISFAEAALSNMLGSIGYFYGASRVSSAHSEGTVPYWKAPLYTAVPSRSFFPRGFLWDDAFHGLLLATWDLEIELDIIHHWFDLMNIEGWIPREQILGVEALSKVPEEFVTQVNTNANPPVFFLTLRHIINNYGEQLRWQRRLSEIDRLFPRLQAWFDWFNTTQVGEVPSSYRWRGRDPHAKRELNPRTLTSGFDDFPRASHPTDKERHVDLRCWMALASAALAEAAFLLGRDGSRFEASREFLYEATHLNTLHWSAASEHYADYGLHSDAIVLRRPPSNPRRDGQIVNEDKIRVVLKDPTLGFIDSAHGYVSLFPFLLEILSPDSPQLGIILRDIKKPELLWTKYGLRSLSTTSPLYLKRNTEHDPPYWRGAIWININFLAVKALYHYATVDGPYQGEAHTLYSQLRKNVISNVISEYKRTGFIWEQYNDRTGEGMGCRPMTGWTALTVMIMAEIY